MLYYVQISERYEAKLHIEELEKHAAGQHEQNPVEDETTISTMETLRNVSPIPSTSRTSPVISAYLS